MLEAVVFGVPGVIYPSVQEVFARYEMEHHLPSGGLETARLANLDSWIELELGDRTLQEFVDEFQKSCERHGFFADLSAVLSEYPPANRALLQAAMELRSNGKKTHVVTNSWLLEPNDPTPWNLDSFDTVVESALEGIRKPDERLYSLLCARSATPPEEIVVVDTDEESLESAQNLGMSTVLVRGGDKIAALRELSELFQLELA